MSLKLLLKILREKLTSIVLHSKKMRSEDIMGGYYILIGGAIYMNKYDYQG